MKKFSAFLDEAARSFAAKAAEKFSNKLNINIPSFFINIIQ